MNLVRSLSPSFSMSLAGTVLCVLVVTTPTYGQTGPRPKLPIPHRSGPIRRTIPTTSPVDDGKPVRVPNSTAGYTTRSIACLITPGWRCLSRV